MSPLMSMARGGSQMISMMVGLTAIPYGERGALLGTGKAERQCNFYPILNLDTHTHTHTHRHRGSTHVVAYTRYLVIMAYQKPTATVQCDLSSSTANSNIWLTHLLHPWWTWVMRDESRYQRPPQRWYHTCSWHTPPAQWTCTGT